MRINLKITGQVQGVGFRPFIYKIANDLKLGGFVKNSSFGVEIEIEGDKKKIDKFEKILNSSLPPLAKIDKYRKKKITPDLGTKFEILKTTGALSPLTVLVSPDVAVCKSCLKDIKNQKKYLNYFATNCTNCGARYSIIKTLPYDRKNTSMAKFKMCESCKDEYENPTDRRFHTQPIGCNSCGAKLKLIVKNEELKIEEKEIYKKISFLIKQGKIGAIKGIGGFHLVCDGKNDEVVKKLREFKNRPTKPFAIMCKNLKQIKKITKVNKKEREILISKESPIVILKKRNRKKISNFVAPNIGKIGCFLPYTPLHHLLFKYLKNPIIATSANLSSEPIITNKDEILEKLPFVDFVIDFNRDIVNAVDDSLVQVIDNKIQTLRLSRGFAPKVIKLPFKIDKKILAVGGQKKNSLSLAYDDTIIISPHIGDLGSLKSFNFFLRTLETFKNFYDFQPKIIVCDKHPFYETSKWAKELKKQNPKLKIVEVQHHLAHIYSCKAEFNLSGKYTGFSFDGTGFGDDETLWGGEVFVGDERRYFFKPIKLLGGEKAIKEPRRIALSLLFEKYTLTQVLNFNLKSFTKQEIKTLHQSYQKNLNSPLSSSVGRLFDGVASLANLIQIQSYEGEAGLLCEENFNSKISKTFEYSIKAGEIEIKFDFFEKNIVTIFINTLAKIIVDIAKIEKKEVILSGGVFQNKTLLELVMRKLKRENIIFYYNQKTPINDGGISLGQIYYFISKGKK